MDLSDLEVYKLARDVAREAWGIYEKLDWQTKKTMGDQFICAMDSVGANIAEGFGRYHYLDKNKFNYNARGSLLESIHWVDTLAERSIINKETQNLFKAKFETLGKKLNNYIKATKEQIA